MIKTARKPSSDPVQERLRQNKAAFNKEVSAFINDLIHLKKTMNGWPSKFFKERSKIITPIPGDPTNVINNLAQRFQDLSQTGNQIVQEQLNYAKNRRLRRPEQAAQTLNKLEEKYGPTETTVPPPVGGTPAPPTATDLTKQLSAHLEQKYQLTAEGSNPFSRFLARMRTPQVGFGDAAQVRRLRMDMLKAALQSYRSLGKLQVQITRSSKESIQEAHKMMQMAWNQWSMVSRNFNNYVNSLPDRTAPPRPEDMKEEGYSPEKEEAELGKPAPPPPVVPVSPPPDKKEEAPEDNKFSIHPPLKGSMPPEEQAEKKANSQLQLEAVAQAFLRKWLGKTRHQILPGKSSGVRLQVYELAAKTRNNINQVMDLLEKGLSIDDMGTKVSEISYQMNTLRSLMRSLAFTEKTPKGQPPPAGFF